MSRQEGCAASGRRRSTTLCGEDASSEPVPLDVCSLRYPTESEHHNSSTLLLSGDSEGLAGVANQQYSKLLRQHRQWCLPAGLVRTGIKADGQEWSGTYTRADGQGWSGTCTRADGQGRSGTCIRADGQQHRPSSAFSDTLRRASDTLRLQRSPCLPRLSCMQAHIEQEHAPPALRIDIHHCTLLCAHAQTSKRGGRPI